MRRGFTLIEMLTVIVVLATLAAIMAPNLASSVKTNTKRGYLASIDRLPARAKQLAISSGAAVTLIADEDGGFQLEQSLDENEEPNVLGQVTAIETIVPDMFVVGQDETASGEWAVRFFPDGTSDRAGIEFDENGNKWHLSINGQGTGKVASGELPIEAEDRWPAGDYVQRS